MIPLVYTHPRSCKKNPPRISDFLILPNPPLPLLPASTTKQNKTKQNKKERKNPNPNPQSPIPILGNNLLSFLLSFFLLRGMQRRPDGPDAQRYVSDAGVQVWLQRL